MADADKKRAAEAALKFISSGMKIGLGTGSTADHFIDLLGEMVAGGLEIACVPTSERSAERAEKRGIPLTTLEETPLLDLTVDGADEISPDLTLIKGGGGALLREKIVAAASEQMIVIADRSKCVDELGAFPLPVEVNVFGHAATRNAIEAVFEILEIGGPLNLRMDGDKPYVTDGGHYIYDAHLGEIPDPLDLAEALLGIPGVIETGLFVGLADIALVASGEGVEEIAPFGQNG